MATDHLQVPDIAAAQNQKEVTANAAHNLLDRAMNQTLVRAVTGNFQLTTTEQRENAFIELTGTPGAFFMDMNDTNERILAVFNNTDGVATIRNSAAGGAGQPVLAIGDTITFHYDGTDFLELTGPAAPVADIDTEPTELFVLGTLATTALQLLKVASRPFLLPDGLTGSEGLADSGPNGGAVVFAIEKNGDFIGDMTFADATGAAQVATFSTLTAFADRILLLPFDGDDGDTDTVDFSSVGRTMTFNVTAQIDTAESQFGGSALLLDGNSDFLESADTADLTPGASEAYTIHCWIRLAALGAVQAIVSHYDAFGDDRSWLFFIDASNRLNFLFSGDGIATTTVTSTGTISVDTWTHVAVTRDVAGNIRLFIGGTIDGTGSSTAALFNSATSLRVGANASGGGGGVEVSFLNGHIDELEVLIGAVMWTANFTPPNRGIDTLGREAFAVGDSLSIISPANIQSMADMAVSIPAVQG